MFAIETHDLTRHFGDLIAVEHLNLHIPTGTVFGFLGPNGAGKTTTVRMLTALIAPTRGSGTINGLALGTDNTAIRRTVGMLTETPGLYDRLSAYQNLMFFAQLYDIEPARAKTQVDRYLHLLGLWERRHDIVGGFSKGMRQKIAITRALLHEPTIIFLDEPTAGLDPEASRLIRDFIKNLRTEGHTIFLTTHNLLEADELCDLIGLFRTRLLHLDTPDHLRSALFGRGTRVKFAADATQWRATVEELPFVRSVKTQEETLVVTLDDPDAHNPLLIQTLVTAGAPIRYVEAIEHSLEDVYLELINREHLPPNTPHQHPPHSQAAHR